MQQEVELTAIARQAHDRFISMSQPQCVVLGGETTVKVKGNGLGGRNLEVALSSVTGISTIPGVSVLTLATDGEDGPTDAAGAFVTNNTHHEALRLSIKLNEILNNNDAYHALERLGGLLKNRTNRNKCKRYNIYFL